MTRGSRFVTALSTMAFLAQWGVSTQAQAPSGATATPRGIYLAGTSLGVSAEIEIERDGKRGLVPPTFEFRTGDRFWLHVTANRNAYVYVLNRTLTGDPQGAASRGIKLMQQEDLKRPAPDAYTMVFPAPNTAPVLVKANVSTRIPSGSQYFEMDSVVGAEKLMVIAADKPADIAQFFDKSTGRLARAGNANDSSSSVLNRLNSELVKMADNSTTEETPRSRAIEIKPLPGSPARRPEPAPKTAPVRPDPPKLSEGPGVVAGPGKPTPPPDVAVGRRPGVPLLQELTLVHVAR